MSVSYFVRYEGQAESPEEFLAHYRDRHVPLLARFPRIRRILLHTPTAWQDAYPIKPDRFAILVQMEFDSLAGSGKRGGLGGPRRGAPGLRSDCRRSRAWSTTRPPCPKRYFRSDARRERTPDPAPRSESLSVPAAHHPLGHGEEPHHALAHVPVLGHRRSDERLALRASGGARGRRRRHRFHRGGPHRAAWPHHALIASACGTTSSATRCGAWSISSARRRPSRRFNSATPDARHP